MSEARQKREKRVPSWVVGLVLVVILVIASLYAFTKQVPWHSAYEVKAVFASAQNLRSSSPVRIAGVEVGKVTDIQHLTGAETDEITAQADGTEPTLAEDAPAQQAAIVTMELTDDARPMREDATFKLRPRLFLEGNYFVDVEPGSPNAGEVEDGHTFPVNQTAYSVQLDQVLTTLQSDVRTQLQVLLNQFGNALIKHGGAEGFRELYRTSPASYKFTSQVNEAFLGTERGDLSGLIKGLDRVVNGLGRNERALQGLVTNLRIFSGSFAAEDVALGQAIDVLPDVLESARPAFANLNRSFPALRAFAREALPGTRSAPATLDAATPFIDQVRALVSREELRGLVADLRPTIPELAEFSQRSIAFMKQARALSSCFNEVVIPWSSDTVDPPANYPHGTFGKVYEATGYGLVAIAGESRSGDGNGQYIRVQGSGGQNTVSLPADAAAGRPDALFGLTPFPISGSIPSFSPMEDSAKTPFKPKEPCEDQEPPDLGATLGTPPPQTTSAPASPALRSIYDRYMTEIAGFEQVQTLRDDGQDREAKQLENQIGDQLDVLQTELETELGQTGGSGLMTAIRKHLRDFVAVAALLVVALVVTTYIVQEQRLRIPVFEERPFELKAEFETAQAVVPGQGQTIRVAGVRIGDVAKVDVEDGVGVVTFAIDREFLPVYRDATILMRPTTGLKDMFFELDPGTQEAGEYEEGDTVSVGNTAPDVNLDEILAALDSDTQAYLRLLIVGAGEGLSDRDKELGKLLGSVGPINRDLAKLNRLVSQRKDNLARLVHNFNLLTTRVGQADQDLTELVSASNGALGAIAEQDPNVQRTVSLLPSTLSQARETLDQTARLGAVLGPAFNDLRPFARALPEVNSSTKELAELATPVLQNEIRPFVRAARKPVPDLRRAARDLSEATPSLTGLGKGLNKVVNMAAFNPNGAEPTGRAGRDEGYLYWLAWLGHNGASVFSSGDGNGWWRRIYLTMSCSNVGALAATSPIAPAVTGFDQLLAPGGACH